MTSLSESQFLKTLESAQHTLFRLELQPEYNEPHEMEPVERFTAGDPQDPLESEGMNEWLERVKNWVENGIRIERVRVHDIPPTPYQQWERWLGKWNSKAGEQLRYMTRSRAYEVGLLPTAGNTDWWLIDSTHLIVMHFDSEYRRTQNDLIDDPATVVKACGWRDLAVHHSTLEELQVNAKG